MLCVVSSSTIYVCVCVFMCVYVEMVYYMDSSPPDEVACNPDLRGAMYSSFYDDLGRIGSFRCHWLKLDTPLREHASPATDGYEGRNKHSAGSRNLEQGCSHGSLFNEVQCNDGTRDSNSFRDVRW